ncbi:hypothetical protein FZEAL_5877 [Fusarium zealandicum]|uniref:Uncharacterized protein n=1 Tax=Fusarium zealandicum TaxID=1053134 RepID=A0A8H4XK24_9HYPO|nr:hypothetical protein FZEAL_5877 [Fusarium zealandicum]
MCVSNSSENVCGIPVSYYVEKERGGTTPVIRFCDGIQGIVLQTMLRYLDSHSTIEAAGLTSKVPRIAHVLVKQPSTFWPLLAKCQLDFGQGKASDYDRLVFHGFRETVKRVERKAVSFGAIIRGRDGWSRGQHFSNDEAAGSWFRRALDEKSSGPKPSLAEAQWAPLPTNTADSPPVPQRLQSLAASRWNTPKTPPASHGSAEQALLPAFERLCVNNRSPGRQAHPANLHQSPGRRVPLFPGQPTSHPQDLTPPRTILDDSPAKPQGYMGPASGFPNSIQAWTDGVQSEVRRSNPSPEELGRRMDNLNKARSDHLTKLTEIDREEMNMWASSSR